MTKKLFLHDIFGLFCYTKKCLLALFFGAVASFLVVISSALFPRAGSVAAFLNNTATFLFLVLILAIPVILAIAAVQTHRYFYRSFWGEERLFTLMLPIPHERMLLSRLLANCVGSLLFALLGVLALFVGMLLPFELLLEGNVSLLSNLMRDVSRLLSPLSFVELLIFLLAQTVLADAAISAGTVLFPRRRALGILLFLLLFCGGGALVRLGATLTVTAFLAEHAWLGAALSLLFSLLFGTLGVLYTLRLFEKKSTLL